MTNKPTFLIIGAMKAGTTSLHKYLEKHPDIHMTNPKELHFFINREYDKSQMSEYFDYFKSNKKVAGSTPQNYTKRHQDRFGGVPKRLKEHLPEIKIIYLLRDPISRIESHFKEAQAGGYATGTSLNMSLSKNINNHHYVRTSQYFYQLEPYISCFAKEQILLIESESLKNERFSTMNEIFEFLQVDTIENEGIFDFEANTGKSKVKDNIIGHFVNSNKLKILKRIVPLNLKTYIKNSRVFNSLSKKPISIEKVNPEIRKQLSIILSEDVAKLRKWSGKDFSSWSI